MKTASLFFGLAVAATNAFQNSMWQAPGPKDFRGPCPMMNTLANHGFLPHDGRNITKANAVAALGNGINFDPDLASLMWEQAVIANPEPNATFFTLDHLNRHNVLEHDASMSRSDAFFGNNHVFNQTVFDATRVYWTTEVLTAQMLADGKLARQITSRSQNPNYTFTETTEHFSLGEVAAPIIVFGDMTTGTVNRTWNERLPSSLGWTKKEDAVTLIDVTGVTDIIDAKTSLITP
ncbi:Chloroperoxidase [Diaporthe sp. PMI_573]|nr:Chloroperoxidase [Diaporthaceae sp. PMI_573]